MGKHKKKRTRDRSSSSSSYSSCTPKKLRTEPNYEEKFKKLQQQIEELKRGMSRSRDSSYCRNTAPSSERSVSHLRDRTPTKSNASQQHSKPVADLDVPILRGGTPGCSRDVPRPRDRTISESGDSSKSTDSEAEGSLNNILNEEVTLKEGGLQSVLPMETLKLMGEDPTDNNPLSFELHSVISQRWGHILANGLKPDVKNEILARHPTLTNMKLNAPLLNPEVSTGMTPKELKKDKYQTYFQDQLGRSLEILSQAFSVLFEEETPSNIKKVLLPIMCDSTNMLCDLHHRLSIQRRSFINPSLQKPIADLASTTPVDDMLYGKSFSSQVTAIKAAKGISREIKTSQAKFLMPPKVYSSGFQNRQSKNVYRPSRSYPREQRQTGRFSDQFPKRNHNNPQNHKNPLRRGDRFQPRKQN